MQLHSHFRFAAFYKLLYILCTFLKLFLYFLLGTIHRLCDFVVLFLSSCRKNFVCIFFVCSSNKLITEGCPEDQYCISGFIQEVLVFANIREYRQTGNQESHLIFDEFLTKKHQVANMQKKVSAKIYQRESFPIYSIRSEYKAFEGINFECHFLPFSSRYFQYF